MPIALMIAAALAAYIVKGMCGFANTLVFSTALSFAGSNANISPIEGILGLPSNFYLAFKHRKEIKYKNCIPLILILVAGLIPGAFLLKYVNVDVIKIIFGFFVLYLSVDMFIGEYRTRIKKPHKATLAIIAVLSGILCGLFGIGAMLASYFGKTTQNTKAFKGNLCFVFTVENICRLILYTAMSIVNLEILKTALMLMPVMIIGFGIGLYFSKKINEKLAKKFIIIMLGLSAISLIVTSI